MRYYKKNANNLSDLRSHIVRNSALFLRISYGTKNLFPNYNIQQKSYCKKFNL